MAEISGVTDRESKVKLLARLDAGNMLRTGKREPVKSAAGQLSVTDRCIGNYRNDELYRREYEEALNDEVDVSDVERQTLFKNIVWNKVKSGDPVFVRIWDTRYMPRVKEIDDNSKEKEFENTQLLQLINNQIDMIIKGLRIVLNNTQIDQEIRKNWAQSVVNVVWESISGGVGVPDLSGFERGLNESEQAGIGV